jgi:hypothetical protein
VTVLDAGQELWQRIIGGLGRNTGKNWNLAMPMYAFVRACFALALFLTAHVVSARAATFNTYSFTQTGYTSPIFTGGGSGTLTGTFGGTVDENGFINLDNLVFLTFQLELVGLFPGSVNPDVPVHWFFVGTGTPTFFSFLTTGGNSTLAFASPAQFRFNQPELPGGQDAIYCVGAAAALGLCGPSGSMGFAGYPVAGALSTTMQIPIVELISSVETPLPAALPLFAGGLATLGALCWRRNRRAIASAA